MCGTHVKMHVERTEVERCSARPATGKGRKEGVSKANPKGGQSENETGGVNIRRPTIGALVRHRKRKRVARMHWLIIQAVAGRWGSPNIIRFITASSEKPGLRALWSRLRPA